MRLPQLAGLAGGLAAGGAAMALEIDPPAYREAGCLGAQGCVIGAATLAAGPAPEARLSEQVYAAVTGLGVSYLDTGADRDDELQGPILDRRGSGETLTIAFARPHRLDRIVIAHLYNPDMPGDPPETALIEGFRGEESLGTLMLRSMSDEEGAFILGGTAPVGVVRRLDTRAGQYVLFDPFDVAVDRLVFSAPPVESGDSADYSIVSVAGRPAP